MSTSLSVLDFGFLLTMGISVTILIKAVITRVRTVWTAPFFLKGEEQILGLSREFLVVGGAGGVGVGKLGAVGNHLF